jgi:myxalamid-type polyketide synthase MxaE and MxaD
MGLSSLLAMELRNRLELLVGRSLSATLVWNYPTIDGLVGFLAGDSVPAAKPATKTIDVAAPAALAPVEVAKVADLSDADAARLLRRRR